MATWSRQAGPHPLSLHRRDHRGGAGHRRGPGRPRVRRRAQAARHRLCEPDQDDDLADHLLHDRAGHRLGTQGRQGRRGRRSRARLLRGDVDWSRSASAWSSATSWSPATGLHPDRRGQGRGPGPGLAPRPRTPTEFLLGIIPTTLVSAFTEGEVLQTLLVALLVGFALQAMGSAGRAGAARRRAHPAARLPRPRDDHVGRADRRLRRDRRGHRVGRSGRAQEPRRAHARLLRHLLPLRLRRARHAAARRRGPQHPHAASSTWAGSSC